MIDNIKKGCGVLSKKCWKFSDKDRLLDSKAFHGFNHDFSLSSSLAFYHNDVQEKRCEVVLTTRRTN